MASDPTQAAAPTTEPVTSAAPVSLSGLTLDNAQDQGVNLAAPPAAADFTTDTGSKGTPIAVVQETPIDKTRQRLAFVLLATLLVIIAVEMVLSASFAASCWLHGACATNAEPAMQVMSGAVQPLFTAMVGLVGSVVGFYFGSKTG